MGVASITWTKPRGPVRVDGGRLEHRRNESFAGSLGGCGHTDSAGWCGKKPFYYQQIATALADLGYERTWQQCKTKIKNLTQRYRKVTIIASIVVVAILPLYWIVYNQFYAR